MSAKSTWSDSEEWWRKRLGRVVAGDDEAVCRILFQSRRSRGGGRAALWRAWSVERNWRRSNGPQILVKAVGNRKSISGTRACLRYISRRRAGDAEPVEVFDEFGRSVDPFGALRDWDLLEDHENLSRKARDDPSKGEAWPERRRLHFVQTYHLILSLPAFVLDEVEDGEDAFEKAAMAGVDEAFTARGFRVLWCRHDDTPDHPHLHLVVKAVSLFGERLRFDRQGEMFDHLRQVFAENFCRAGLKVQASRREDRVEMRNEIMAGREALRPQSTRFEGDLAKRAPHWVSAFGNKAQTAPQTEAKKRHWWSWRRAPKVDSVTVPPIYEEAVQALSRHYVDPVQALHRWLVLARGERGRAERALALWYLRRRPEIFGPLCATANEGSCENAVVVLRRQSLPPPLMLRDGGNDDAVLRWTKNRRRRRCLRDRWAVIGSLWRLAAQMASASHPDAGLAREILRRARRAMDVEVQWDINLDVKPGLADVDHTQAETPANKPGTSPGGMGPPTRSFDPPLLHDAPQSIPSPRPRRPRGKSLSW